MIWEILDDWMFELDMMISFGGKVVGMHDTMSDIGVSHDCTLRCTKRFCGGAQRFRQPQPDIPGQWGPEGPRSGSICSSSLCCWSYRSATPEVQSREPYVQAQPEATPTHGSVCFGAKLSPVEQPMPVDLIDAAASGSVPAFPTGSLDWLRNFLQQILSPEDYLKYKSSFEPSPQKEEVPLALQLANKTKELGSVLAQIERERVLVSDLKAKSEKHTETLTQLMERKYSLEREIEELESLSAAAEAKQQGVPVDLLAPGPPQTPQPVGPRDVFPGPPPLIEEVPQDEEGDDEAMEPGDFIPGAGVVFIKPIKRKLAKATAVKRVLGKGLFSKGRRSSLIVKAASLSTQDLVLLQEQVTELSNSRQNEDKNEVQDIAEQGSDISATELEPSASLG